MIKRLLLGAVLVLGLSVIVFHRADAQGIVKRGGGGVCGSNTYVQFNDSGACGSDAGLVYDKTNDILTVAATVKAESVQDPNQGKFQLDSNGIKTISTKMFAWASGGGTFNATDTALARNAAGVVEINTGTAGVFGGLKISTLTGSADWTTTGNIITQNNNIVAGSSNRAAMRAAGGPGFAVGNTTMYGFSADGTYFGTIDGGLARSASGIVEVNNGTAGTGGMFQPGRSLFAALGTPANGTTVYCSDCTFANPCASGGTGAIAMRLNSAWRCD